MSLTIMKGGCGDAIGRTPRKGAMREIKFRVWNPDSGTLHRPEDEKFQFHIYGDGRVRGYYHGHGFDEPNIYLNYDDIDLVALFYTGLHDKNGVEIYEGDILRIDYDWLDPFVIDSFRQLQQFYYWDRELGWSAAVIGNIYENPELLK